MDKKRVNGDVKRGRVDIAAIVAIALLSACSGPIPVPVQTLPQQKSEPSFVDLLRELLPGRAPAQPKAEPARAPETYPPVVWPAPGAGDFQPYWYLPEVVWPAPGAGDFPPGWYLPEVVWPPPGTEVVAPAPAPQPESLPAKAAAGNRPSAPYSQWRVAGEPWSGEQRGPL